MGDTKHLKEHQFKAGQSGNPSGRSGGPSPKERMTYWLRQSEEAVRAARKDTKLPLVDRIAAGMVVNALDSTNEDNGLIVKFFDSMADRIDGKATQHQEVIVTPVDLVTLEDRRLKQEGIESGGGEPEPE